MHISHQHDSPWPKVLLLMRCGRAKRAGILLRKYVDALNNPDKVPGMRRKTDGSRLTDGTCRLHWSNAVWGLGFRV